MSSPLSSRSYVWSFVGQKSGKPTREAMLSEMSLLPWNSFTHLTEIWDDPHSLSASEVKSVYSNSIFVPCPRGNDSLDSFRVWEALEAGALPIVEKDEGDYFRQLLGSNCLIQAPPDWSGVAADIEALLKSRGALDQVYHDTMKWWEEYKKSLKSSVSLSLSPYQIMHNGLKVVRGAYHGDWMANIIEKHDGHHEPEEEEIFGNILATLPPNPVMIECGSFWAYYSMWFKQVHPDGVSIMVEPLLNHLEIGKNHFSINKLEGNFEHGAIGARTLDVHSFRDHNNVDHSIPCWSIDGLASTYKLTQVDILHADIQGGEEDMLRGASTLFSKGAVKNVVLSTHGVEIHERCLTVLEKSGFEIRLSTPRPTPPSRDGLIVAVLRHSPLSPSFSSKTSSFLGLRDEWIKFKDFEFFNYISSSLPSSPLPAERFSCYNPGHSLAIVSLYTPEISDYAIESEMNIRAYCEKHGYTFYVYRETLDRESHGNWSKPKALLNHIDDHEAVIWMDSDTLIFNDSKRFEEILERCVPMKKIIACEDVGSNNKQLPQGSLLNSGVVIFRRHQYTKNLLERWWDFRKNHDTSSLYASGGDQEVLINILKDSDGFGHNRKIFPMNTFNTDPRLIDEETFIIHFMAYPFSLKKIFMKYWNS